MKNKKYFFVYAWAFIILILIGTPMEEYDGGVFTYYDKFAHAIIFGFFAFLLFKATYDKARRNIKSALRLSFFISLVYALLGELIQLYVPGRTESFWDFVAGLSGVSLVLLISAYASRKK